MRPPTSRGSGSDLALAKLPETDAERLRILTETAAGDDYDVLVPNAVAMHVEAGILVRVAAIEDLIRVRRAGSTPEDTRPRRCSERLLTRRSSHRGRRGTRQTSNPERRLGRSARPAGG